MPSKTTRSFQDGLRTHFPFKIMPHATTRPVLNQVPAW